MLNLQVVRQKTNEGHCLPPFIQSALHFFGQDVFSFLISWSDYPTVSTLHPSFHRRLVHIHMHDSVSWRCTSVQVIAPTPSGFHLNVCQETVWHTVARMGSDFLAGWWPRSVLQCSGGARFWTRPVGCVLGPETYLFFGFPQCLYTQMCTHRSWQPSSGYREHCNRVPA